jgi:hypothetical protein
MTWFFQASALKTWLNHSQLRLFSVKEIQEGLKRCKLIKIMIKIYFEFIFNSVNIFGTIEKYFHMAHVDIA